MTWTVRSATLDDLTTLVAFNQQMAFDTEGKHLDETVLTRGVRRALEDPSRARYFVVEDPAAERVAGSSVVGQLMLTDEWSDWRDGRFLWIQSVYVRPSHRRCGVYRALHEHVVTMAKGDDDVVGVRLYVETENDAAQQTYAGLGMERCGYFMYEQLTA